MCDYIPAQFGETVEIIRPPHEGLIGLVAGRNDDESFLIKFDKDTFLNVDGDDFIIIG